MTTHIAQQVLSTIQGRRMDGLGLGNAVVYPVYDALSLINIPGTAAHLLGAPGFGAPPLDERLLSPLSGPYKKVIVLLVDALGYGLFCRMMADHADLIWHRRQDEAVFSPITSVCPSTTATALTSLWTGEPPARHGIIGYEMWAKEFGMVINNILHSPAATHGDVGGLSRAGFDPREFLKSSLLGPYLKDKKILPTTFIHRSIAHSGLSEMQMDDVQVHTYVDEADLFISLAEHLNRQPEQREYVYVYYSDVDTLMHRYGDGDPRVGLQFRAFSWLLEKALLEGLSDEAARESLLILTADHGSMVTPNQARYDLNRHPDLLEYLVMQPTCEHRLAFFYIKPGHENAVRTYIQDNWPDEFTLLDAETALTAGLFGSEPHHPRVRDRLGNLIAAARGDAYFWWAPKPNHMRGRHGGLSPEEMLVPFYALPLG